GAQCALIVACFLCGVMTTGLGFIIIAPISVAGTLGQGLSQVWGTTFPFMIPAITVAIHKRPKVTHACYWLSLSPLLTTVLVILWWAVCCSTREFHYLYTSPVPAWQGYVAGAISFLSLAFSAFLWSIYKGHKLFFGVVLVLLLALQWACLTRLTFGSWQG